MMTSFKRTISGILALALTGCGGDDPSPMPTPMPTVTPTPSPTPTPTPTPSPTPTASPVPLANLQNAATYQLSTGARAVVVIQNGNVVLENYANGGSASRSEGLASGTKSFACALMVGAQTDGFLDIDDLASQYIPAWAPGGSAPQPQFKQEIRIRDLLASAGGILTSGQSGDALNSVDSYAQAVNATSRSAPDTALIYTPNNAQALNAIFELSTGASATSVGGVGSGGQDGVTYLTNRVFTPIGIAPTGWQRDIKNKPNFGGGAAFTAADWARFGQFTYQYGAWNGVQILPVAEMRRCLEYRSTPSPLYGFGWWINRPAGTSYDSTRDSIFWPADVLARLRAGGKFAPSAPDEMAIAFGAGNRKLYVIPSLQLSIVVIAGANEDEEFFSRIFP